MSFPQYIKTSIKMKFENNCTIITFTYMTHFVGTAIGKKDQILDDVQFLIKVNKNTGITQF